MLYSVSAPHRHRPIKRPHARGRQHRPETMSFSRPPVSGRPPETFLDAIVETTRAKAVGTVLRGSRRGPTHETLNSCLKGFEGWGLQIVVSRRDHRDGPIVRLRRSKPVKRAERAPDPVADARTDVVKRKPAVAWVTVLEIKLKGVTKRQLAYLRERVQGSDAVAQEFRKNYKLSA